MTVWLIGAGVMAQDYAKVLDDLGVFYKVVGRSKEKAVAFEKAVGCPVITGGLDNLLKVETAPKQAIVAVGIEQLFATAEALIRSGTKRLLIEKPAGLNLSEIKKLEKIAISFDAMVFVAYNRRFYSSVDSAKKIIEADGGITSCKFDFTEWAHEIITLQKAKGVKERWLLGNSSHVIDLVFHLIGRPSDWKCWYAGSIEWHPASSCFVGSGVSEQNILFSYHANWQAPGRWGVEIQTAYNRLILRPMEELKINKLGSVLEENFIIGSDLDNNYKPGLFMQTKMFLDLEYDLFCSISEHVKNVEFYYNIAGYC